MQSLTKIFISAFSLAHLSGITFCFFFFFFFLQTFHWGLQYHILLQEIIKVASRFMVICSGNSRLTAISQMMLHKDKINE